MRRGEGGGGRYRSALPAAGLAGSVPLQQLFDGGFDPDALVHPRLICVGTTACHCCLLNSCSRDNSGHSHSPTPTPTPTRTPAASQAHPNFSPLDESKLYITFPRNQPKMCPRPQTLTHVTARKTPSHLKWTFY